MRVPRDPSGKYLNRQTRAGVWSADVTFFDRMPAGGDLMLLHPDGREEVLVRAGDSCVADPCVSFDGEWVYYAYFHDMKNRRWAWLGQLCPARWCRYLQDSRQGPHNCPANAASLHPQ